MRHRIKTWWFRIPATVRKPIIIVVGSIIIVAGLAMLALPGPGWATIFLGFAVLATEFAFAERVRDWFIDLLKTLINFGLELLKAPWKLP